MPRKVPLTTVVFDRDTKIPVYSLSRRTQKILENNGYEDLSELYGKTRGDLARMPGIGAKAAAEIEALLMHLDGRAEKAPTMTLEEAWAACSEHLPPIRRKYLGIHVWIDPEGRHCASVSAASGGLGGRGKSFGEALAEAAAHFTSRAWTEVADRSSAST